MQLATRRMPLALCTTQHDLPASESAVTCGDVCRQVCFGVGRSDGVAVAAGARLPELPPRERAHLQLHRGEPREMTVQTPLAPLWVLLGSECESASRLEDVLGVSRLGLGAQVGVESVGVRGSGAPCSLLDSAFESAWKLIRVDTLT